MPFLHSLLCFKGADNRQRFLYLTFSYYISFMLLTAMSASSLSFSLIILIVFLCLSTLTALRRLNDANLQNKWLIGASLTFLVSGGIIILTESPHFYWLILIPSAFSSFLLTYPSKGKQKYILGYAGPVNLNIYQESNHTHQKRIEPKLVGTNTQALFEDTVDDTVEKPEQTETFFETEHHYQNKQSNDLGTVIREKIIGNKKNVIILFSVIAISIILLFIFQSISFKQDKQDNVVTPQQIKVVGIEKSHEIPLQDNFSIWLSPHSGLIVNWQAKATDKQKIWSLTTGKGDTDCQDIEFNNGKKYRTLAVVIENDIERYAQFSPIDTRALIQDIAFRGSFELCGYTFSLKGSQSALGKNPAYAEWVEY